MGPPIRKLTPELIQQHPALAAFAEYIQNATHRAPVPGQIQVSNDRPQDGLINLTYLNPRTGDVYIGQLDANLQILHLRHGIPNGVSQGIPQVRWEDPTQRGVAGSCQAVRTLGGDQEDRLQCTEATTDPSLQANDTNRKKLLWTGGFLLGNYSFVEVIASIAKRRPLPVTNWLLNKTGFSFRTLAGETPATFGQMGVHSLSTGIGALGFGLGETYLSDAIGLRPRFHDQERFALGAVAGYGAYRGSLALLNSRFLGGKGLMPTSFSASLLSSALVDATLGQFFEPHSTARLVVQGAGFFLPQMYRSFLGTRTVAEGLVEKEGASRLASEMSLFSAESRLTSVGRWGGRIGGGVLLTGFLADLGYMGMNHLNGGNAGSGRTNYLYERATALQGREQGLVGSAFHGLASFIAPALTQRYLVSDRYVDLARTQMEGDARNLSSGAEDILRHTLFFGSGGNDLNPDFYRRLDWNSLQGSTDLHDVVTQDGRTLPVEMIAEQLSYPAIHERFVQMSSEEQVQYIQRQYRGHHLSVGDVQTILTQINLTQVRRNLADLHYVAGPDSQPLLRFFDQEGSLRPGQEMPLVSHLFPNQEVNETQILGLRRVALLTRILELQAGGSAAASALANLTHVAQELGLADAQGTLIAGEELSLAQGQFARLASSLPTPNAAPAHLNDAQIIQNVIDFGTSSG